MNKRLIITTLISSVILGCSVTLVASAQHILTNAKESEKQALRESIMSTDHTIQADPDQKAPATSAPQPSESLAPAEPAADMAEAAPQAAADEEPAASPDPSPSPSVPPVPETQTDNNGVPIITPNVPHLSN